MLVAGKDSKEAPGVKIDGYRAPNAVNAATENSNVLREGANRREQVLVSTRC